MNKKPKRKLNKLALGGALIGGALFISLSFVNGYDQQNTHPALTDEAIDFYNLNFSNNPLTQEDKEFLIKGVIEEDTPPRWFNHFYDPIYDQGWLGYTTSRKWAISSTTQQAFSGFNYGGFANLFGDNLAPYDFSYERALHDYATGNRKRAMLAMGHVMHLLEDANVPEHTRGDTHLPWHGTESPYEKTMAKWNPGNIDIAKGLFKKSKKPILLNQLGDYFDEIAGYSNGYFFSQDTIFNVKYSSPEVDFWKYEKINNELIALGYKTDQIGKYILVKKLGKSHIRNLAMETYFTLDDDIILDDYWERLSTDFVVHGAGALKLFLDQAEIVKQEYGKNDQSKRQNSGLIGQFLGFLGFSRSNQPRFIFDPKLIEAIISQPVVLVTNTQGVPVGVNNSNGVSNDVGNGVNRANNRANDVGTVPISSTPFPTPLLTPLTPLTPLVSTPTPSATPLDSVNQMGQAPSPTPSLFVGMTSGSSGSSGSNNTPTPAPTPTLTSTPTPLPTVSSTPSPSPSPTASPTPVPSTTVTPTPTPTPLQSPIITGQAPTPTPLLVTTPARQVVINEIAWMGTESTATLSNDEWLELYNPTSLPVNVGGWQLVSLTDNSPNITLTSKTIDPYGFFLLERTSDDTISDISANQIYTGNLKDNIGEILELRDNQGNLQDLVSKSDNGGWYGGDKDTRSSMERIDPLKPGDNKNNWTTNNDQNRNGINAAGNPINGTPREQNSVFGTTATVTISQNFRPEAITDLAVDSSSFFGSIKLIWTTPADTDTLSASLSYDIRYSTKSFDTINDWNNGSRVVSSSVPLVTASGTPVSVPLQIFDYNRDYYFVIKTQDEAGYSQISNQPKYTIKPAISGGSVLLRGPAHPLISWQFELPTGFSVSQPGLANDGTVYFGSHNNFQGKLYAINPNGTEKWHLDGFNNQAPSFPVVADDGVIYFGASGGLVYAVNPDMSIRWQSVGASGLVGKISIDMDGEIMFTDTANIPVNDRVFKIKPDGTAKWNVFLLTASGFTPITGPDGDAYISSRWGANGIPRYYRLNGDNGTVVWQVSPNAGFIYTTDNLVYDQTENKLYATSTSRFQLFTINLSDGQLTEDMIKPLAVDPTTKVTISGDLLVVGASLISNNPASGSAVYGVDKTTKSVVWTFPIGASISANPYNSIVNKEIIADVDGNFYFSTKGGKVFSIDRGGRKRWMVDLGSNENSATDIYPVLGDGAIYVGATVGTSGRLFKISD